MEQMITKWLCILSLLIAFIWLLRFIQAIWLRKIDAWEKKEMEERNIAEHVNTHNRKLELLDKQEEAKESERQYQLKLKE